MKLLKINFLEIVGVLILLILFSCEKQSNNHYPLDETAPAPLKLEEVSAKNIPGGVVIYFDVPNDPNLLFVSADFERKEGELSNVKASYYTDSLVIDGFGDTEEHEAAIYTVGRSGKASEAITVVFKPLESPIWDVFRSIELRNTFGGYDIIAKNPTRTNIRIVVSKLNDVGEYEIDNDQSVFTSVDSIVAQNRGLPSESLKFGFSVTDNWGNTTDTLFETVNPLEEIQLDRSKFRPYPLEGDAWQNNNTRTEWAWDGDLNWPHVSFTPKDANEIGPNTITIDLGQLAKLSRVLIFPYPENGPLYYYFTTMKRFELWGSPEPNPNGEFDDSWYLLGSYTVVKPSGLPYGTENAEDREAGEAGFNWETDSEAPKIKYLRVRCLENFGGGYQQSMAEIYVFGQPD